MSRNPHRLKWIGRDGIQGRTCHAPGCYERAGTVRAQQLHADLFEPHARLDARSLMAPLTLREES